MASKEQTVSPFQRVQLAEDVYNVEPIQARFVGEMVVAIFHKGNTITVMVRCGAEAYRLTITAKYSLELVPEMTNIVMFSPHNQVPHASASRYFGEDDSEFSWFSVMHQKSSLFPCVMLRHMKIVLHAKYREYMVGFEGHFTTHWGSFSMSYAGSTMCELGRLPPHVVAKDGYALVRKMGNELVLDNPWQKRTKIDLGDQWEVATTVPGDRHYIIGVRSEQGERLVVIDTTSILDRVKAEVYDSPFDLARNRMRLVGDYLLASDDDNVYVYQVQSMSMVERFDVSNITPLSYDQSTASLAGVNADGKFTVVSSGRLLVADQGDGVVVHDAMLYDGLWRTIETNDSKLMIALHHTVDSRL